MVSRDHQHLQNLLCPTKINRQILNTHIMNYLIIGSLHKRTINITERHQALRWLSQLKSNRMLFSNANIKNARCGISFIIMFMDEPEGSTCYADNLFIFPGQFYQWMSEYILILGRLRSFMNFFMDLTWDLSKVPWACQVVALLFSAGVVSFPLQ